MDDSEKLSSDHNAIIRRSPLQHIRRTVSRTAPFAAGVLAALLAFALFSILFPGPHIFTQREVNDSIASVLASATPPPAYSAKVYQVIRPALVIIETRSSTEEALGSGVVVDDSGDILTSLHVVANSTQIKIIFADGTQADGKVIATRPENDIALLSANRLPAQVKPAVLGNPNIMHVGDEAYVVGNPFGLYGSMSSGIISGFDRSFQPPNSTQVLQGLIQIDASVNPGNSGGPLLNRNGEVIGIVTGIVNPTNQDVFIGIGFAVPITVAGGALGSPPY